MKSFCELFHRYDWRQIKNCPGRYIAKTIQSTHSVSDLLGEPVEEVPLTSSKAKDAVVITRLEGGGLISFKREDGTYLHTLNTPEGFQRKLAQLGLSPVIDS